jgi:hypothetical protein
MGNSNSLEVRNHQKPDVSLHHIDVKAENMTFGHVKEALSQAGFFDRATHCLMSGKSATKLGDARMVKEWFEQQKERNPNEVFVIIHPKPKSTPPKR